ncbi:MAG TPA: hypothetical protein VH760_01930 [Gaiellaceae bacterium]
MRGPLVAAAAAAVALAGCGSSSRHAAGTVTVPAYGVVPVRTATTTAASDSVCRTDAGTLVDDAHAFVVHIDSGAGAYPADLNYVIVRDDLARFRSHGCDPAVLGRALAGGLTGAQRSELVANLPGSMAQTLRAALADA